MNFIICKLVLNKAVIKIKGIIALINHQVTVVKGKKI